VTIAATAVESSAQEILQRHDTQYISIDAIVVPAQRMRRLRPEVVDQLAESIGALGLLQPVVLRPNGAGYELAAGVHRFEAVKKRGHGHIAAIILDSLGADQALLAQIDENLVRVDLSPAEWALHCAERKRLYEKLHPETKLGATGKGRAKVRQNGEANNRFTADAATKTGKSERTIQREIKRAAKIPGLADVVGTALDTPDELDRLAELPPDRQRELIDRAISGEDVNVRVAVMKDRRTLRELQLADATKHAASTLGRQVYGVIYADPPWRYSDPPMGDVARANEQHYPTMTVEEIKALAIPAADDCVLFLWATVPKLDVAFEVMHSWGFTHKSASVWKKDREGTGYWVRGIVEHLLIGVRGNIPAPAPGEQFKGWIEAPRGRHSEKPAVFAEHIERLFPSAPKIELFARRARPGWDVWGNEAPQVQAANGGDGLDIPTFLRRAATR
jgi:ParB/RepB/Spo0J family partition protein